MGYSSLAECVADLESTRQLVRIDVEIDPYLEAAEIHRRVNEPHGPALLFARVKGCAFPMVSNLFGTLERTRYLFRDAVDDVRKLVRVAAEGPGVLRTDFWSTLKAAPLAWHMLPKRVGSGPIVDSQITIPQLPQMQSWPRDGGAFVTLPLVYSEDIRQPGWRRSNLGMYRIQLSGGQYAPGAEIGLHYQIHRGIGVHHTAALQAGQPFPVNIWVGGPPALTVAAVMPLPEGMSELGFAGALGRRRVRLIHGRSPLPLPADADFCITGTVIPNKLLPEGPFGDHLGYYSLAHDFPVLRVEQVYHRRGAIWPFTVVGRPPQEDTSFGEFIHELTGPMIPKVLPGVRAVHAVDAAGVHPLLLAIGSERYTPYQAARQPQEILTQAHAILGQGQLSLAKYLLIVAGEDNPQLDIHQIEAFLRHLLERIDWRRDLHFQTCTTSDTLDYSGGRLNEGSKVVWAARGPVLRELPTQLAGDASCPAGFSEPCVALPGVLVVKAPEWSTEGAAAAERFSEACHASSALRQFPLIILVDDSRFAAQSLNNLLWVTFTRSDPAADLHGVEAFIQDKHWGCRGPLVIDARIKPHHAPPLEADPDVCRRVDALAARGGPLHGWY